MQYTRLVPKKILILIIVVVLSVVGVFWLTHKRQQKVAKSTAQTSTFNKSQNSIDDPSSPWVIVNKQRALPSSYMPANLVTPKTPVRTQAGDPEMELRSDAAQALEPMISDAKKAGLNLMVVSGYRSYQSQDTVYKAAVAQDGQTKADQYSARPGHSEHQTGLAVDLGYVDRHCELDACFGETDAGRWLAAHAHEYGFVLRYKDGTQHIVGYNYEPWHFRYTGKDLSNEVNKSGQTLEEFFNLPSAPNYK